MPAGAHQACDCGGCRASVRTAALLQPQAAHTGECQYGMAGLCYTNWSDCRFRTVGEGGSEMMEGTAWEG